MKQLHTKRHLIYNNISEILKEVIEPDDGICAIGSGGNYALAAARALKQYSELSAEEIAKISIETAADICVFTNKNIVLEKVGGNDEKA